MTSLGVFTDAADSAKYLTLGVAAITGILATISSNSQFGLLRN